MQFCRWMQLNISRKAFRLFSEIFFRNIIYCLCFSSILEKTVSFSLMSQKFLALSSSAKIYGEFIQITRIIISCVSTGSLLATNNCALNEFITIEPKNFKHIVFFVRKYSLILYFQSECGISVWFEWELPIKA